MKHRILGRGAIACSAVVAAQWIPSLGNPLPGNVCHKETEPDGASSAADSATVAQDCSSNRLFSLIESLPEQFKLQWSQGRSRQLPGSIEREYKQLVEQAQTLASENRIAEAIVLMNAIPQNSRYFDLAYQMQETWSQETLHEAAGYYQQADLSAALKLLEAVPTTSSQYAQATQLKQKWQQEAAQMQRAIAASKSGAWQQVIQQLEAFKGTPLFQSLPVQELLQLAMIRVLEPDPGLLQIASRMDSTGLSAAPLPPPPVEPMTSSSLAAPPPPPIDSRLSAEVEQLLNPAPETMTAAKTTKSDRQAIIPGFAPSLRDSTLSSRRSSLPSSVASAIHRVGKAIAEPELISQR